MPVDVTVVAPNLEKFQGALALYLKLSSKGAADVLKKKAKDLGIRLYQGFSDHKMGGPGPRKNDVAFKEMKARAEAGLGTYIRPGLRKLYKIERAKLNRSRRSVGQLLRKARTGGTLSQWAALTDERALLKKVRSRLWNRFVGIELGLRQSGAGVLAASFLWLRKVPSSNGSSLVANRMGGKLGEIILSDTEVLIQSFAKGVEKVSDRYGILDAALAGAAEDMLQYAANKQRMTMQEVFAQIGLKS